VVKEEFGKRAKRESCVAEKHSTGVKSKKLNSWRIFCHFHGRGKSKIYLKCLLFVLSRTIEGQGTVSDT
jgi:hypothetical protein